MLGLHSGVVLINDLLPDTEEEAVDPATFRLLLRDTGRLHLRMGGAGGSRLIPEFPFAAMIFLTGVFGSEMEDLCSCC